MISPERLAKIKRVSLANKGSYGVQFYSNATVLELIEYIEQLQQEILYLYFVIDLYEHKTNRK